jgi:predicted  nucleic acid-binding Zn-ribbon protein
VRLLVSFEPGRYRSSCRGKTSVMNPLLFPPTLIKRALDDLGAIADAARQLDALRAEVRPIQELTAVREQLDAVRAAIEPLGDKLDTLRADIQPIQQLAAVRAGIEPLDDDLRQVRQSIENIEPLVKAIGPRIDGIDDKLAGMSGDLAPVGDLAEKMPGISRR